MSNSKNIICFFSFGYSHVFYEKLIRDQKFNDLFNKPDFIFIAPNRVHKSFFDKNNYEVYYLRDIISKPQKKFVKSNNQLIASQKKSIINLPAKTQENIYFSLDEFIHNLFSSKGITHLVFSQAIEGLEGILLAKNARKLKIKCFVPHSCRFLGNSFLNDNQYEEMTILKRKASEANKIKAKKIINEIRVNKRVQKYPSKSIISNSFFNRVFNFLRRVFLYEKLDIAKLKVSVENNLSSLYELKYFFRRIKSEKYFEIRDLKQIKDKIIFYPLQYTPESSINIPNPYFVDQLRLIDLIRFNMPEDYLLFVKENPSMYGRRQMDFYKSIFKKSGVRLVHKRVNTFDVMHQADLVVSVSGTACLEAFIIRTPSLVFGTTFYSSFINKSKIDYNNLNEIISRSLNRKIDDDEIEESIALILENSSSFKCGPVDMDANLISVENVNAYVKALESKLLNDRE